MLSMELRFGDLRVSSIYKHLISVLDVNSWPRDECSLVVYGDGSVQDLIEFWKELLTSNGCVTASVLVQWDSLKNRVRPLLVGDNPVKYLDIWARVLTNNEVKE